MTISAIWRRLLSDKRGIAAVTVAICLPLLIGFAGLGVDTGWWYTLKRQNQSAADAAAISAGYEVLATNPTPGQAATQLMPAVSEAAARNGYTGNAPTVSYPFAISGPRVIRVTLQQPQAPWFSLWFLPNGVTIANEAGAKVCTPGALGCPRLNTACVLATVSPTGTGGNVEVTGSASVSITGCSIVADSTSPTAINSDGGSVMATTAVIPGGRAATLVTAGEVAFQGSPANPLPSQFTLSSSPLIGAPALPDPYAGTLKSTLLTSGAPSTNCAPQPANTTTTTPMTYTAATGNCIVTCTLSNSCAPGTTSGPVSLSGNYTVSLLGGTQIAGGLSLTGNGTVNLSPGTYWFTDGSLSLNGTSGNITLQCPTCSNGAGVTLIFTTTDGGQIGTLSESGNVTTILNAPGSGSYAGLLMLQDKGATYANFSCLPGATSFLGGCIIGSVGSALSGLIYFPNTDLGFGGSIQTTSNCLVVVASSFTFTGNIDLNNSGCAAAGLSSPPYPYTPWVPMLNTVTLAE
jgi:Putative Flp pilus-assembly TadE/G-like